MPRFNDLAEFYRWVHHPEKDTKPMPRLNKPENDKARIRSLDAELTILKALNDAVSKDRDEARGKLGHAENTIHQLREQIKKNEAEHEQRIEDARREMKVLRVTIQARNNDLAEARGYITRVYEADCNAGPTMERAVNTGLVSTVMRPAILDKLGQSALVSEGGMGSSNADRAYPMQRDSRIR